MATWHCVSNCGACCNLTPQDRPDLDQYLSAENLGLYHSMVGEDGWCIHYSKERRQCNIYSDRPSFCRVQADTFEAMFDIDPEELDEFAIDCCEQQIEGVYGANSDELRRFDQAVNGIEA
ncbi:MAG: YkgJ family cysteine cluster protein [Synechococcales cyanobacterium RM1_1_8]|nr:YkgJ family cysteine cluster protein [Synechococcales cyanobacterium RM1_1_8]